MKAFLHLSLLTLFLFSCSSTKEPLQTDSNVDYSNYENKYYIKKSKNQRSSYSLDKVYRPKNGVVVRSEKISKTVNEIIEEHTGNPISQIARSDVYKTNIGYEWKFTNVSTGQSYKIETNRDFEDIQVKMLSSISDF